MAGEALLPKSHYHLKFISVFYHWSLGGETRWPVAWTRQRIQVNGLELVLTHVFLTSQLCDLNIHTCSINISGVNKRLNFSKPTLFLVHKMETKTVGKKFSLDLLLLHTSEKQKLLFQNLFKNICMVNSLRRQTQCVPLRQKAGLLTVQYIQIFSPKGAEVRQGGLPQQRLAFLNSMHTQLPPGPHSTSPL